MTLIGSMQSNSDTIQDHTIQRLPLNEQIARAIRQQILNGDLRHGARMVQTEWAEKLNVSRMPVRDAFLRLQSEGLLVISDGGVRVAELSEDDVRDAYRLHGRAVGLVAQRAAIERSADGLAELRTIQDRFKQSLNTDDIEAVSDLNTRFYKTLTRESNSARLAAYVRTLSTGTPPIAIHESVEWRRTIAADHELLLDALKEQDADAASTIAEAHVLKGADFVIEYLRRKQFW